jgi:hypothetical protein
MGIQKRQKGWALKPLRSLPFQGPKKYRFQGPPLIMALVLDIARLKIITYRAIKTTGTLIVKRDLRYRYSFEWLDDIQSIEGFFEPVSP